jgi:acid phosphatase
MRLRLSALFVLVVAMLGATAGSGSAGGKDAAKKLSKIQHIVVIYEENHSFDNLYGGWEGVNGRSDAPAAKTIQISQAGAPYACLLQNDVNLTSPPLPSDCNDATTAPPFTSHFTNAPFSIENYIPMTARTCPPPGAFMPNGFKDGTGDPGGCTKDIVHRFYQEQYQLNNGQQNRYTTGSDALGLTQGYYDTTALPIYQYLHSKGHPDYAIADDFFQSAFGGSFLNHQWLVAAATPPWAAMPATQHAIVDSNGMPNGTPPGSPASAGYALYHPTGPVRDPAGTRLCPVGVDPNPGLACGDYAVNTIQPPYQPTSSNPLKLSPQMGPTIGDRLSAGGVSWAWYSGGWSNANGDYLGPGWTNGPVPGVCGDPNSFPNPSWPYCPNKVFQFHHQPFNYYANFAPGTPGRAHLQDEVAFQDLVTASSKKCQLNSVSFIKPIGLENEHPGYTNVSRGSNHLVQLISSIENSKCAKDTMIIVTYDEFGGQWDHVSPPGQGGTPGPHDQWGPGTRLPALILAKDLKGKFVVDSTQYDTTSILATIEQRYGLAPVSSRDAAVNSLVNVFEAKKAKGNDGD